MMTRDEAKRMAAEMARAIGPEWKPDVRTTPAVTFRPVAVLAPLEVWPSPIPGLFLAAVVRSGVEVFVADGRSPKLAAEALRAKVSGIASVCRDAYLAFSRGMPDPRAMALADEVEQVVGWEKDVAGTVAKAASKLKLRDPDHTPVLREALLILDKRVKGRGEKPIGRPDLDDPALVQAAGAEAVAFGRALSGVPDPEPFTGRSAAEARDFVEAAWPPSQGRIWMPVLVEAAGFFLQVRRVIGDEHLENEVIDAHRGGVDSTCIVDVHVSDPAVEAVFGRSTFSGTPATFRSAADLLQDVETGLGHRANLGEVIDDVFGLLP